MPSVNFISRKKLNTLNIEKKIIMYLIYLKPIFYAAALHLSFFNPSAPEFIDFAAMSKHATLLNYASHVIRDPMMLNSLNKICAERFPEEFIQTMQTPLPSIHKINSYFYPEALEITEGKRPYDEKKYKQIIKSITDLSEKLKINFEKFERSYDIPIQQELTLALSAELNRAREYQEHNLIFEDQSFKTLLMLMVMFIDFGQFINVEKKDFHYAAYLGLFALELNYFFERLAIINNNSKKLSFIETKELLEGLVKVILDEITALNRKIDIYYAHCTCNEHYLLLDEARRINEFTEKILSCFRIQINQDN